MVETRTNASRGAGVHERRLPEGATGLLLVGKLRSAAPSAFNGKMLGIDVESATPDGRIRIDGLTGFMFEPDGAMTMLGSMFTGGHIAKLLEREVCVAVTARAAVTKAGGAALYWTVVMIYPFEDPE